VSWGAGELEDGLIVPIEPKPLQALENSVDRFGCGAFAVGILYAQQERPACVPGEKPIEQGGSGSTYVEETGWARGEPDNNRHVIFISNLFSTIHCTKLQKVCKFVETAIILRFERCHVTMLKQGTK
jgi:hypothetical protein